MYFPHSRKCFCFQTRKGGKRAPKFVLIQPRLEFITPSHLFLFSFIATCALFLNLATKILREIKSGKSFEEIIHSNFISIPIILYYSEVPNETHDCKKIYTAPKVS